MRVEDVWCDDILEVLEKLNLPITIWTMDYGLWTMDYELWTMDYELWIMDYGL